MSDIERVTRAKKEADDVAYKRGFREGVDVTMWAAVATGGIVYLVLWIIDAVK
jgi:hypothetical protein